MSNQLGTVLLIIIVVGGLGSLAGAFIASILIGVLQTLAISTGLSWGDLLGPLHKAVEALLGGAALAEPLSRFATLVPFVMVIAILVFRPRGLMGQRE
jgi:branched-chain amino acid transport system permease protein